MSLDENVISWKVHWWNCCWMKVFWMKVSLDESVKIRRKCFGWKCHWMKPFLDESVIGWNRVWMNVSVDEIDLGWKCQWMKSILGWKCILLSSRESAQKHWRKKAVRKHGLVGRCEKSAETQSVVEWSRRKTSAPSMGFWNTADSRVKKNDVSSCFFLWKKWTMPRFYCSSSFDLGMWWVGQYGQGGFQLEELAVHASTRFEKQPKQPHKVETQVEVAQSRLCLGVDWKGRLMNWKKSLTRKKQKKSALVVLHSMRERRTKEVYEKAPRVLVPMGFNLPHLKKGR